MKIDRKIVYIFSSILLVILSLLLFYPFKYLNIIVALVLLIGAIIVYLFIKKRKNISINRNDVILIVSISGITYLMGYYLLGLKFGFLKTLYPINISNVFTYLMPITLIIITFEYIRYALISYENKVVNVLVFITSVILEVLIVSSLTRISTFNQLMDVVALTFVPSIVTTFLYDYLVRNYGSLPNIVYRLITTIYLYLIPIVPNVPGSIFALIKLFFPLVILFIVKMLYEKKEKIALKKNDAWSYVIYGTLFTFLLSTTLVFSGQLTYSAVVIATESMTGTLNKGDIVFYKQYQGEEITEKEIIIFEENGVLVVHTVVEKVDIDGEIRYYTKGDFNLDRDPGYRTSEDIVGKTTIKVPYIGYITLWLNEMFNE